MAEELHCSSRPDNKRKFRDPSAGAALSPPARRSTGFSAPIASSSPDGGAPVQPSYDSVSLPLDGIELAKQRAQEIAARLFSDAEAKRPRVENGGGVEDSREKGFGSFPSDFAKKPFSHPIPSQVGMTSQSFHTWGPPGAPPMQPPGYGYMTPGSYPGPPPQSNMSQQPYGGYPASASTGFSSGWNQTPNQPTQQTAPAAGYDYYNQQSQQQQQQQPLGGSSATAGSTSYNYGQPLTDYNNQVSYGDAAYSQASMGQQGYMQDGYSSGYNCSASQPGYYQPTLDPQNGFDQQGYGSASGYGMVANPSEDGSASAYSAEGGSTQAPPSQQAPSGQPSATQGYTGQPPQAPISTTASYPTQGTAPSGYGIPPTSQLGHGSQVPTMAGYGQVPSPSYGQPSQVQDPPGTQGVYRQGQQAVPTEGGCMQIAPVQPGYKQPPPSQAGYDQQQTYGVSPHNQPGYGPQQQQPYSDFYAGDVRSQPPAYSSDNAAQGAYDASPAPPSVSSGAAITKSPTT
ncbi:hypothetical protein BHM03_00036667 [Ensete ventricosum]|nr:hypothetical protein BHM03_00036667 [Ensete ventricosum]